MEVNGDDAVFHSDSEIQEEGDHEGSDEEEAEDEEAEGTVEGADDGVEDDVPPAEEASPTNEDATSEYHRSIKAISTLDSLFGLRELGREALCWQLSSAKPGNGVEQLLDPNLETYWQSDGNSQPHWIQLHFGRRVAVSHVCLYLDYQLDESYTPRRVIVEVGMTQQDLIPACQPVELIDPSGWCIIPLQAPPDPLDDPAHHQQEDASMSSNAGVIKTHLLRISVLTMHQNGRDTHVRHVHLYGPRVSATMTAKTDWSMSPVAADRYSTPVNHNNSRRLPDPTRDGMTRPPRGGDDEEDGFGMLQSFSTIR